MLPMFWQFPTVPTIPSSSSNSGSFGSSGCSRQFLTVSTVLVVPGSSGFYPLHHVSRQFQLLPFASSFPAVPAVPASALCINFPGNSRSSGFCPLHQLSRQFPQFRLLPSASAFPAILEFRLFPAVLASALYISFPGSSDSSRQFWLFPAVLASALYISFPNNSPQFQLLPSTSTFPAVLAVPTSALWIRAVLSLRISPRT